MSVHDRCVCVHDRCVSGEKGVSFCPADSGANVGVSAVPTLHPTSPLAPPASYLASATPSKDVWRARPDQVGRGLRRWGLSQPRLPPPSKRRKVETTVAQGGRVCNVRDSPSLPPDPLDRISCLRGWGWGLGQLEVLEGGGR